MGITGNGKSAACNFFMQNNFKAEHSFVSVSNQLESGVATIGEKHIELIDTPGFSNPNIIKEDVLQLDLATALINVKYGFHMLGLVFNVSKRIETPEDELLKELLLNYKHYLSYAVILFTHGKFLGDTEDEQKDAVKEMIEEAKKDKASNFFQVLEKINYRYLIIESVESMEEGYHAKKSKELVAMIDMILKETGRPATNEFALSMAKNHWKVKYNQDELEGELADETKASQEMTKEDESENTGFYANLKYGGLALAGLLTPSIGLIKQRVSAVSDAISSAIEQTCFLEL